MATRPRKTSQDQDVFNGDMFERLADDLKSGHIPSKKYTLSDTVVTGLRVIIRNTGGISYHVQYTVGDDRPYLKLGDYPDMSVSEARNLARTVTGLAGMGIDVQDGLHERLVRELKAEGLKWRVGRPRRP
ncbi:MAG: DUF4102 domain-containing protein [Rhodoplanes sp.]|uniref:Arm DNA-binding domain-containing protein n=1 Tax=Rhodoplanes sp. TaxID=1968906 RepID=UPI0017F7E9C2|nr:Arm DNA-binding domain-containing protein [Rhodoplanes sp.]NVO13843.1 DUF4102 domain-containing protein [Rhodoplanes sp.]